MDKSESYSPQIEEKLAKQEVSKENLSQITLNVARYITEVAPQAFTDSSTGETQINYYFAGSFAANLFSHINSYRKASVIIADKNGINVQGQLTISQENRVMSNSAKTIFETFPRKLGDLDVTKVSNDPYDVAKFVHKYTLLSKEETIKHIPLSVKLFKEWENLPHNSIVCYDILGADRPNTINNFIIAKMDDSENHPKILLAHPTDMIAYKLIELLQLKDIDDDYTNKIEHDIYILHKGLLEMEGDDNSLLLANETIATNMGYSKQVSKKMREKLNSTLLKEKAKEKP